MTEIKICGLTSEEDIRIVNNLSVDYAGFVFVKKSRRSITPAISQHLVSEMNKKIKSVALFVNGSVGDIESALEHVNFDYIQLHGNESVKKVEDLSLRFGKPIIKAIGVSDKFNINNIDINIITQTPKISKYKNKIVKTISNICELSPNKINIKGKTTEKLGLIGKEKAIACEVITSVVNYD